MRANASGWAGRVKPRYGGVLGTTLASGALVVSHDPEHLALLLADQLVERDARLVAVRGLQGSAGCPLVCFGHLVIDVMRPRDPLVPVRQPSANPQLGS